MNNESNVTPTGPVMGIGSGVTGRRDGPTFDSVEPVVGKGEIDTLEKLNALDQEEVVAGYMGGWDDPSLPIGKSPGYMHGWLNAQVDKGRMKSSEAMRRLANEYVNRHHD